MTLLVLSAVFFLAIHWVSAIAPLRQTVVKWVGDGPYLLLFSVLSVLGLVGLGVGFSRASADAHLYDLGFWALVQTTPITFLAFQFIVLGFLFPNPTSIGGDEYLTKSGAPRPLGIQHVTRHPFLWGVTLWSGSHLLANGATRSVVLFGTLLLTAAVGTLIIDAKRRRALGEQWDAYAGVTSNLPFLAMIGGRTQLSFKEIGWWRPLIAAAVFALFYVLHGFLFGVSLPPSH